MPPRRIDPVDAAAPTRRLRLTVAYDGRTFRGWQSQSSGNTVQDRLEAVFAELCGGARIPVHGSGRTDAGVHARGQVAHVDVPVQGAPTMDRWHTALNARLPHEIRIRSIRVVPKTFHARFDAQGKIYRYRIWNHATLDPFEVGRAWHLPGELDLDALRQNAALLVGKHDFASFAANRRERVQDTERTIRRISVHQHAALLTLDYEGDGFLYKMVRLMTGSLIRCAQHKAPADWIATVLASGKKTSFAAPADGLYLMRVLYDGR